MFPSVVLSVYSLLLIRINDDLNSCSWCDRLKENLRSNLGI